MEEGCILACLLALASSTSTPPISTPPLLLTHPQSGAASSAADFQKIARSLVIVDLCSDSVPVLVGIEIT